MTGWASEAPLGSGLWPPRIWTVASLEAPNVQILAVFAMHWKKSVPEPDRLTNWLANWLANWSLQTPLESGLWPPRIWTVASLEAPNVQILGVFAMHLKKSVPGPDRLTNWPANLAKLDSLATQGCKR